MTQEQKDKILTLVTDVRDNYTKDCEKIIAEEQGKITGVYYMAQRMCDIIKSEYEVQGK